MIFKFSEFVAIFLFISVSIFDSILFGREDEDNEGVEEGSEVDLI